MKKQYTGKYNDSEEFIALNGYGFQSNIVTLYYQNATENLNGFIIYDPDENILKDCSEYRYRYDVLEDNPNVVYYTDLEDMVQTEKWQYSSDEQMEEPLTNAELTECVADLMYETSLMQLGMEG